MTKQVLDQVQVSICIVHKSQWQVTPASRDREVHFFILSFTTHQIKVNPSYMLRCKLLCKRDHQPFPWSSCCGNSCSAWHEPIIMHPITHKMQCTTQFCSCASMWQSWHQLTEPSSVGHTDDLFRASLEVWLSIPFILNYFVFIFFYRANKGRREEERENRQQAKGFGKSQGKGNKPQGKGRVNKQMKGKRRW